MKARSVLAEACLNLRSGTARALTLALLLAVALGALGWLDVDVIARQIEDAQAFQSKGASTIVVDAPGRIGGKACERLRSVPGVLAAGAIRPRADQVRSLRAPQQSIPAYDATPGLAAVLGVEGGGRGSWLSRTTAAALGLRLEDRLDLTAGSTLLAGVYSYPSDGRTPGLDYALIEPVPADSDFDQCWFKVWPLDEERRALASSVVGPGTAPVSIGQLNQSIGATFDGPMIFAQRATRGAPIVAAALGLIAGFLAWRLRRVELASALHAGVSKGALWLISSVESLAVGAASVVLALPAQLIAINHGWALGADLVRYAALPNAMLVWGLLAGASLAVASTKERHLFGYFKAR